MKTMDFKEEFKHLYESAHGPGGDGGRASPAVPDD